MHSINARQAREHFSQLLNDATNGQSVTITRHGQEIARIVPAESNTRKKLPNLTKFRSGITIKGRPLSEDVAAARSEERF